MKREVRPVRRRTQEFRQLALVVALESHATVAKQAVHLAAAERNWRVLDAHLTDDSVPPAFSPSFAILRRQPDDPMCEELRARGVHVVRVGIWPHPMDNIVPAVLADREAEGRLAAEHFAERGFRSVGMIHFVFRRSPLEVAFSDHAAALGCRFNELDLAPLSKGSPPDKLFRRQRDAFVKWISNVPRPIGILLRSDYQAARICHFCSLEDIPVPDEVALMGRGNSVTTCDFAPVRLTSIHPNYEARIAACFEILDSLNAGCEPPKQPVFVPPKSIVTRESTDVHASDNPEIARALRYMWNHYDDSELTVDMIAAEVGFSRRKLERIFRSELDQSVNGALLARRMERYCELLITPDASVSELCTRIGLRSREHVHRTFKRFYGMTPHEFREKHRDSS